MESQVVELGETKAPMNAAMEDVVLVVDDTKGPSERTGGRSSVCPVDMDSQVSAGMDLELGVDDTMGKGPSKRTGTVWTATALIITAVIGSSVLPLVWAIAQLGWVTGLAVMLISALVNWYTSSLMLADDGCHSGGGDMSSGKRDHSYADAVRADLGGKQALICGSLQYAHSFGVVIEHTHTASTIIGATMSRSATSAHKTSTTPYTIIFGVAGIFLSQILDYDQLPWLSIVATVMSFIYSIIGIGLGIVQVMEKGGVVQGSLTGISIGVVAGTGKLWRRLQALSNIALAYSFTPVLFEIHSTLPSSEAPAIMRRASVLGSSVNTFFSLLCGAVGYAAMGDSAPGNLLAGLAKSYHTGSSSGGWLLDVASAAAVVHLAIAYQLCCQPLFAVVEQRAQQPLYVYGRTCKLNLFRLAFRTALVAAATALSAVLPSGVAGLLGALVFWPLAVYFPVHMCVAREKVSRWSTRWVWLQLLSLLCLAVTVAAWIGYLAGIVSGVNVSPQQSSS